MLTMVFRLSGSASPQLTPRLRQLAATVDPALRLETVEGVVETWNNGQKFLRLMAAAIIVVMSSVLLLSAALVLVYLLFFFILYLFAHSAFISYLKGTAVRITPGQFPDLYERVSTCCVRLNVRAQPEAYLLHAHGAPVSLSGTHP